MKQSINLTSTKGPVFKAIDKKNCGRVKTIGKLFYNIQCLRIYEPGELLQ